MPSPHSKEQTQMFWKAILELNKLKCSRNVPKHPNTEKICSGDGTRNSNKPEMFNKCTQQLNKITNGQKGTPQKEKTLLFRK